MEKRVRGASEDFERKLIYFPIIHTHDDLGAFRESVRRATLRKIGIEGLKRKVKAIDLICTAIENVIDEFSLSYEMVRLYQDGLPVCGKEKEIVHELAESGSRNHRLLIRLMERGATLMGTESLELLLREYELLKHSHDSEDIIKNDRNRSPSRIATRSSIAVPEERSESLLKMRDQYIARRINSTLLKSETGILFLGMLHSVEEMLDGDIQVLYPIFKPLFH